VLRSRAAARLKWHSRARLTVVVAAVLLLLPVTGGAAWSQAGDPDMGATVDAGNGGTGAGPSTGATSPAPDATQADPAAGSTSTPGPAGDAPSSVPGAAGIPLSDGGGDTDGAAVGARPAGSSSGPVDSPVMLFVGLAMALGGVAFLALRNRAT